MANWEPARRYPPRTSSRWPAPGIFVNVEFGVSFAPEERTHTASMKYTSKRMEERLHEERIRQQYEQGLYNQQHPTFLMPANGIHQEQHSRNRQQQATYIQQQERQRRLGVRPREQHERGTSAPPTVTPRTEPISPISPVSPIGSLQHTLSTPLERTNQALPPTPSQFRLGEADLPWSMPPWYKPGEPEFASPAPVTTDAETQRLDDPQRVRDLEALHQAMMTVDSLSNDGWEPWTWDSVGDMPRGPRSIGWAVSSNDAPSRAPISAPLSPASAGPPPYVVSQWEQAFGRSRSRPRTSST